MKIHIPGIENMVGKIGGGFTFSRYFFEHTSEMQTGSPELADIIFIVGASTCKFSDETFSNLKSSGKKIVLRLDGVPEDWRNRGGGVNALMRCAKWADGIVSQSNFTQESTLKLIEFNLNKKLNSKVIYNGVDKNIFKPLPEGMIKASNIYVNVNYRKDPNKRIEDVIHYYRQIHVYSPESELWLIGRYPTEYSQYNLGFFNGEKIRRFGIVERQSKLATVLQQGTFFLYPSMHDPAPNAVLEALACGLKLVGTSETGSVRELEKAWNDGYDFGIVNCVAQYLQFFESL